jgi:hypothetical protein
MGLLKHALLPFFGVLHLYLAYSCLDLKRWGEELVGLSQSTSEADMESTRQLHMLGVMRAFNVAMAVLCFLSIVGQDASSHSRGMMILGELIFFSLASLDAYLLGIESFIIAAAFAGVALLGVSVHAMEPGLFTQDKSKAKKN